MQALWTGVLLLIVGVECRVYIRAGSHCHGSQCTNVVNTAIESLELHYDVHLCHVLRTVDCTTHVTRGDEVLCGSDGVTYKNHCYFVKEKCRTVISEHHASHLQVAAHRACSLAASTTAAPAATATNPAATTAAPAATATNPAATTAAPVATSAALAGLTTTAAATTTTPTVTTTGKATTKASPTTTTASSVHNIIANVFCQQANTIDCNTGFNIVCGSDGQYYPNDCELSKAKCLDTSLIKVDMSNCTG